MKKLLFNNTTNYNDIKTVIMDNIDKVLVTADPNILTNGIKSLKQLKNNDRLLSFIKEVDNNYSSSNNNAFNKVPIMLVGFIILDKYSEESNDFTSEEIALLSNFSLCGSLDEYIKIFNHELLSGVCKISNDKLDRIHYLGVVEDRFDMFYEKITENNKLEIQRKLTKFVKSLDKERFDYLYDNLEYKIKTYAEKGEMRI